MATNYFSNHSQSRFLPNSTPSFSQQQQQQHQQQSANSHPTAPRSRLPSSKHFSTSVSSSLTSDRENTSIIQGSSSNGSPTIHPLKNTWVFWFRQHRAPGNKITNYEEGIKKISSLSSVESFWSLWTHLTPPSSLQPTTDYLVFHSGIRRPVWEDPLNITGGKWIIRLKKGVADRIWEDLVLAILGEQFDECRQSSDETGDDSNAVARSWEDSSDSGSEFPEICGATISVRQSEDIVSLWNRVESDVKVRERIRDTMRKVLNLPPSTIMEYKTNNGMLTLLL
ncbi:translation initiation factor eIF4e [Marasmius fiardii PR-910]|nr:translation initiation factor eIF4e [Marasmius fiardii PR-910]